MLHTPADNNEDTAVEQLIALKYAEVLGQESVGVDDDFFALGGNSLQALQVLAAVNEAFSVDLQFADLVVHATPRAFALIIGSPPPRQPDEIPFEPRDNNAKTLISHNQLTFWRLATREELRTYFNLRQGLMLYGPLDVEALRASLQDLTDRHDSLRMHFGAGHDAPAGNVEIIVPERQAVSFRLLEPSADAASKPDILVEELLLREIEQPFILDSGPLIRFTLVRFAPTMHALLITTHHLITDAWSNNLFKRELNLLYTARCRGDSPVLPALPVQYADYAHWSRQLHQSQRFREQLNYWPDLFASLGTFDRYPRSDENAAARTPGTRFTDLSISDQDVRRIAERSAAHNTTPFVLLQTIMHLALYNTFTQLRQMLVLSPTSVRTRPELQNSLGMYITIVGIVSALSPDAILKEFIGRIKRTVNEAVQNANTRHFACYDLAGRKPTDFPLFVYNYLVFQNDCDWALQDLRVQPVLPPDDERAFVTTLELYHASTPVGLWGALAYNRAVFSDEAAAGFVAGYRRILERVLSSADDNVAIASLLDQ